MAHPLRAPLRQALKSVFFCALLFLAREGFADVAYFHPPKSWILADPKHYAPSVQIACIPPKSSGFSPSINFAIEEGISSLEEYVKTIKELHLKDKKKRWRALGTLKGKSAEGLLTEIDTSIDTRPVRLLQCIFEHKGVAYILTAAAETKEMALYTPLFLEAFKSFTITPDLLESIPETSRQNSLKAKLETLKANPELRKGFEKKFVKEYGDMGLHWQLLILKQEYNL